MNMPSTFSERLHLALTTPTNGVLGLVDEVLAVSRECNLQLDWQAGHCRVRFPESGPADCLAVAFRKSVFRAALARIAVLCNERRPNSVSPYGGQGELSVGAGPATVVRVAFANTPDEQSLELVRVPPDAVALPAAFGQPGKPEAEQIGHS